MIFNDYVKCINNQLDEVIKLKTLVIVKLEEILEKESIWKEKVFKDVIEGKMDGSYNYTDVANCIRAFVNETKEYSRELREDLIKIDFFDFVEIISNFRYIGIEELKEQSDAFVDELKNAYKIIQKYRSYSDVKERVESYRECIDAIRNMVDTYNNYIYMSWYMNAVNNNLCNLDSLNEFDLNIRLMSENNDLDVIIDNLNIIESIYKNIEKVVSNEETKLKYKRIESGSLFAVLSGAIVVFGAMKPLLEFGYKVYSEQFSPKAKLELEERKVKVRGEYLRILKEVAEANGIDISQVNGIQELLSLIEEDIKKLYSKNPCISIDGKEIGVKELKDNNIPIERLGTSKN